MIIGDAIYNILSNAAPLTALVGTKIYPVSAPQTTAFPFVVYSIGGGNVTDQKDGSSPIDDNGLEIDCYAKSYRDAHGVANAIRTALDDYSGTAAGIVIRRIYINAPSNDGDFIEDHGFFAVGQNYTVKVQR